MPGHLDDNHDQRPGDFTLIVFGAVFLIGVAIMIGIGWYFR